MTDQERVPCPYCRELILPGAVKCKECGSNLGRVAFAKPSMVWVRNLPDRKFFGVCAAIAKNFHISVTLVRLLFVLATFVHLFGLFVYLVLWAIIPYEPGKRSLFETVVDAFSAALDSIRTRPAHATAGGNGEPGEVPPVPTTPGTVNAADAASAATTTTDANPPSATPTV